MKRDPKILFVCTQMEAGGVQIRSTSMARALRSEGIEASVLFLYIKRDVFNGDPVTASLMNRKPSGLFGLMRVLWRLYIHVRAYRPTAVVGMAHYSSPLACAVGMLCGVRYRVATQTNPPDSYSPLGRVLDWCAGITGIYTSNVAASFSIQKCFSNRSARYRRTLKTVLNGVPAKSSAMTVDEARREFGLSASNFMLICCGRLSSQKNHAFLLDVLGRVPGVHLAILGEGELRSEMEEAIRDHGLQERVTLLGEIEPAKVGDFLRSGDVFVFPSKYEAFGLALVEAMSFGLPIICSDAPALSEVVGEAGQVLALDDPGTWADAIQLLQTDPKKRAEFGELSRKRSELFTFDAMLDGFKRELM